MPDNCIAIQRLWISTLFFCTVWKSHGHTGSPSVFPQCLQDSLPDMQFLCGSHEIMSVCLPPAHLTIKYFQRCSATCELCRLMCSQSCTLTCTFLCAAHLKTQPCERLQVKPQVFISCLLLKMCSIRSTCSSSISTSLTFSTGMSCCLYNCFLDNNTPFVYHRFVIDLLCTSLPFDGSVALCECAALSQRSRRTIYLYVCVCNLAETVVYIFKCVSILNKNSLN